MKALSPTRTRQVATIIRSSREALLVSILPGEPPVPVDPDEHDWQSLPRLHGVTCDTTAPVVLLHNLPTYEVTDAMVVALLPGVIEVDGRCYHVPAGCRIRMRPPYSSNVVAQWDPYWEHVVALVDGVVKWEVPEFSTETDITGMEYWIAFSDGRLLVHDDYGVAQSVFVPSTSHLAVPDGRNCTVGDTLVAFRTQQNLYRGSPTIPPSPMESVRSWVRSADGSGASDYAAIVKLIGDVGAEAMALLPVGAQEVVVEIASRKWTLVETVKREPGVGGLVEARARERSLFRFFRGLRVIVRWCTERG